MSEQIKILSEADVRDLLRIASLARQILNAHPEPEKQVENSDPSNTEPKQGDIQGTNTPACVASNPNQRSARA